MGDRQGGDKRVWDRQMRGGRVGDRQLGSR